MNNRDTEYGNFINDLYDLENYHLDSLHNNISPFTSGVDDLRANEISLSDYESLRNGFRGGVDDVLKTLNPDIPTYTVPAEAHPKTNTDHHLYQIKWGDTLTKIAQRYGVTVQQILALNRGITDPDLIYAGDSLKIPIQAASTEANSAVEFARDPSYTGIEQGTAQGMDKAFDTIPKTEKPIWQDIAKRPEASPYTPPNAIETAQDTAASDAPTLKPQAIQSPFSHNGIVPHDYVDMPGKGEIGLDMSARQQSADALKQGVVLAGRALGGMLKHKAAPAPMRKPIRPPVFTPSMPQKRKIPTRAQNPVSVDGQGESIGPEDLVDSPDPGDRGGKTGQPMPKTESEWNALTDKVFYRENPQLKERPIKPSEKEYVRKWRLTKAHLKAQHSDKIGVIFGSKVSKEFRMRLISLSRKYKFNPDYMMAVIALETIGSFDPKIQNKKTKATGLIQIMPTIAMKLGVTTKRLREMSAEEQLEYVAKYFTLAGKNPGHNPSLTDLYMGVLYPKAIGKPPNYPVFRRSIHHEKMKSNIEWCRKNAYCANSSFDVNKNGVVTKREITRLIDSYLLNGQSSRR